ncbi:cyclin N-terminal domain-containing protein 1-like [Belonocnema kinseyi]|uniref:cyclin N-terminal domain-containing protein 1-like n=1 Tax=Belonocnema kinseyi TaxID=2817044 RepID=UPI00143DE273|nr:cyclin N-terminal domain-containing protein 1-like [Belonocnema kinseyi]
MDFDSSYIESLTDDWLEYIHKKTKEQERIILENKKFFVPYIGLNVKIIKMIFLIAEEFALHSNAKYLAIHLYEKYMNRRICEVSKGLQKSGSSETLWEQEQRKMCSEGKLRLLSCIQLASKMDSNEKSLGICDVQIALQKIDSNREYSKRTIFQSEIYVYKAVEFEMPQCTPKDCVDVLLAATGLRNTPGILEASKRLVDLSYLCHEELYSYLKMMAEDNFPKTLYDKKSVMVIESNALFLGASIALSSVFFVNLDRTDSKELLKRMATLVGMKDVDIWDMANLLFSLAVQE